MKYNLDTFVGKIKRLNIGVDIISEKFSGVDSTYLLKCKHGCRPLLGWQILKLKHCCRQGFIESGKPGGPNSNTKWITLLFPLYKDNFIWESLTKIPKKDKLKITCKKHGDFEQWTTSLKRGIGCPECVKEKEKARKKIQATNNFIKSGAYLKGRSNVSNAETEWLNSLEVPLRQYLIEETGQTVDGFDKKTHTVYLYHGKYWHGCPETYHPDELNPSIGIPMKQLYAQTLEYEKKIKDAGYNLIVKWG